MTEEIVELVLRLAKERPTWGYERIQRALADLGYRISDTTVARILRAHGIEPAPERRRRTAWKTFLKSHWDVLDTCRLTQCSIPYSNPHRSAFERGRRNATPRNRSGRRCV